MKYDRQDYNLEHELWQTGIQSTAWNLTDGNTIKSMKHRRERSLKDHWKARYALIVLFSWKLYKGECNDHKYIFLIPITLQPDVVEL